MNLKDIGITAFFGLLLTTAVAVAVRSSPGPARLPVAVRLPLEVRVFERGEFVDSLGLKDFELIEAGVRGTPEALLLVRRGHIDRQEGATDIRPDLSRKLSILLQLNDYSNKIEEAITYIFTNGLLPGDTLEIQTPVRNYQLSAAHLAAKPPAVLAQELIKIIHRDILQGNVVFNSILRELKTIVRLIGGAAHEAVDDTEGEVDDSSALDTKLMRYKENLQKMEELRVLIDANLAAYADKLRSQPGQKFVFYFYQREFRPEISSNTLDALMMNNQDRPDILAELQNIFPLYHRSITLDHAKLTGLFADSMANVNFLFMNKQAERVSGITMREQSEDIFKALAKIAEATGGIVDSSQNPAASIKTAMKAAESYYLLFYTPSVAAPTGAFLDLEVKVKDRNYKVIHPAGHISRS